MKKYLILILSSTLLGLCVAIGIKKIFFSGENIVYNNAPAAIYSVYLEGEVSYEGRVEVMKGTTLNNLLEAYILDSSDLSGFNLDEEVINNKVYIIPTKGKISINNATLKELKTLSGIGDARALNIINNRPYNNIEELENILGSSIYEKIKDYITL